MLILSLHAAVVPKPANLSSLNSCSKPDWKIYSFYCGKFQKVYVSDLLSVMEYINYQNDDHRKD